MKSPHTTIPRNSVRASYEEEIDHLACRRFPQIQRRLAEEKARLLWQDLAGRYPMPAEREARFVADKTADFLRTATNKDRRDIMYAIAHDIRCRDEERPELCSNIRTFAVWTTRWAILVAGLNLRLDNGLTSSGL